MYSLAYLLVTIMAIYAYRFYKSIKDKNAMKNQNKNLTYVGLNFAPKN